MMAEAQQQFLIGQLQKLSIIFHTEFKTFLPAAVYKPV